MKNKINIKTGLSILLLVFGAFTFVSSAYSQQKLNDIFIDKERLPFNSQSELLRAPGGGPGIPPPGEDDKVGGAPVTDVYWFLSALVVGYGIYNRQRKLKMEN